MLFCVLGETSGWGHERTMAPNVTTHRWSCRERGEGVGIRDVSKFTRCREKEGEREGGAMTSLRRDAWGILLQSQD